MGRMIRRSQTSPRAAPTATDTRMVETASVPSAVAMDQEV